MNIQQFQTDKLSIINWINQLQDYSVLDKVKNIMSSSENEVCKLSNEQKRAIDEAIISIEKDGTIPHDVVMEETKKLFPQYFNR